MYNEAVELVTAAKKNKEVRLCVIADSEGAERQQALYVTLVRLRAGGRGVCVCVRARLRVWLCASVRVR